MAIFTDFRKSSGIKSFSAIQAKLREDLDEVGARSQSSALVCRTIEVFPIREHGQSRGLPTLAGRVASSLEGRPAGSRGAAGRANEAAEPR